MQLPAATKVETPGWLRSLVEGLEAPVPVRIDTEVGGASATVVGGAEQLDLLLMGSRDQGPVRRLLMGSVSTHVVRHAACPVIVVFGREEGDRDAAAAQVQTTT
jgi:nucleotide-binding universal stress UspA family protein